MVFAEEPPESTRERRRRRRREDLVWLLWEGEDWVWPSKRGCRLNRWIAGGRSDPGRPIWGYACGDPTAGSAAKVFLGNFLLSNRYKQI